MSNKQMVKTSYELLSKLQSLPYYKDLLKQGIIPITLIDYKVIYEFYCQEKASGVKGGQLITNVGEEFNIGDRMVYIIVKRMET